MRLKLRVIQIFPSVSFPRRFFKRIGEGEAYTRAFIGWKEYLHRDGDREYRIAFNFLLFVVKFIFDDPLNEKERIEFLNRNTGGSVG